MQKYTIHTATDWGLFCNMLEGGETFTGKTVKLGADITVSLALAVLPWSGDGSKGNPYIIYNKDQLDLLAHRVNGTHGETCQEYGFYNTYFQLANDISYPHKAATLSLAAHQAPDENYWTTFYCSHTSYQINADENACAYTAEYDGANSLTLHKLGSVIPKNTAVIIVGEDNNISLTASDETATVPTNNLHGVDVRTKKSTLGTGTFYVLSQKDDNFGFFEYTAEYMPARKAYLLVSGAQTARELTMVFGEETSIDHSSLTIDHYAGAEWYDLSGRKLNGRSAEGRLQGKKPTKKGIYVNNGHKVMVK